MQGYSLVCALSGVVVLLLTELTSVSDDDSIGIEQCQKVMKYRQYLHQ